jgi:hypothetical protein
MKTFENYNLKYEMEESFLHLAHLDNLEIKFDLIEYEDDMFYFYDNIYLFSYMKKPKEFYMNPKRIWSIENRYDISGIEFEQFMKSMVEKYFNFYDCRIYSDINSFENELKQNFELMKTFENFNNNEKEMESLFLKLSHLDELEIRFDLIGNKGVLFHIYNKYYYMFSQDKKNKTFIVYDPIEERFTDIYKSTKIIYEFFIKMIDKYFNLRGYRLL